MVSNNMVLARSIWVTKFNRVPKYLKRMTISKVIYIYIFFLFFLFGNYGISTYENL